MQSPSRTPVKLRNLRKTFKEKEKQWKEKTAAAAVHQKRPVDDDSVAANLRRSNRKTKTSSNLEEYIDSSGTDDNGAREDLQTPLRAGLRPRRSKASTEEQLFIGSDDEQDTFEDDSDQMRPNNGNNIEENGEEDGDGDSDDEGEEDPDDDDDDDYEGKKEKEGKKRYDLRKRANVCKLSPEGSKKRPRSPRIVLQKGVGEVRRGGSRVHKRQADDSDDSDDYLLVDEFDQGPSIPWGRGGNGSGPPLLFGGLDMHGTSAWGLNFSASWWGTQGDASGNNLSSGVQTAGPSSKGGADIQPLEIDESVSFDEIGGLSNYIDALKEMVFFPLLYPDFFESYHITPPRGVLLCGPPGTGKTLVARALASAASKAGQKVSFYMRKGADVLSKWVGEAERQLKLLFEEAQKNQPSIIFFDEIDGLAPVRSSKQEQIHNSIVSTLLALMDGLDSRGQVVLIGATNRIDAIDGALRRPGRFDREFTFQLPGCEARAEILDIHTRKWKRPPSKELRLELAASCVGYCGADLKALCTEAAIRAFREKYPQVYTSDDKFLIDVESVDVERYHFMEAMSTITPAAHRGSLVPSRPLSPVVAPCLQGHLQNVMSSISDIFPVNVSSELTKLSMLASGSAIPLVHRPRLLICGGDGSGLDHFGPAVLHELEKFPVHSLGLSSLLSDPSAKTPEEALVHIFCEARRTTPSILYLPQFHLWWENAHDQLKAVLLTMLAELPSDATILLLGTSSILNHHPDDKFFSVFPSSTVYRMGKPSNKDRSTFFNNLILDALSILSDGVSTMSRDKVSLPQLPKAPKIATGPKPSELKAQADVESHAIRRLRMCLRDICNRILYDKRFKDFNLPVTDEDAPNYCSIIQNHMDMATLLERVDSGKYITSKAYLDDFDLILANAKKYYGDDYKGARIVSRACELRDRVHGMVSEMDPALVAYCEQIAAKGGPVSVPDDFGGPSLQHPPVVQMASMTKSTAPSRTVQPEANPNPNQTVNSSHADRTVEVEVERSNGVSELKSRDVAMSDAETRRRVRSIKKIFVKSTYKYRVTPLERLYNRVMKRVFEIKATQLGDNLKSSILDFLFKFAEDKANF